MPRLSSQQRKLAILNVIGGVAILSTYAFAAAASAEIKEGLWGTVFFSRHAPPARAHVLLRRRKESL